jgi:hypothetical protein
VRFLRNPDVVEQNRRLPCDCNDGLILGLLATSSCKMQAPMSKRTVSSMWPEKAIWQQTSFLLTGFVVT